MVEDTLIKTTISPFAIREGEIKKFAGKDGYVSINQIINKINIGHITEVHFKLIEIVNEFEFATSRQLLQLLELKGIEIASQEKLNNKLEQLVKLKILTRYYFESEDGQGIYRIYCLEKMGKYMLTSKEIECKWQPTDNIKPVEMIKKRLAGNQTLIAYMQKVGAFQKYEPKPTLNAKMAGKKFKVTGGSIKIEKNKKTAELLFEVVRRDENWENKLVEKMRLYQDFYDNFVTMECGFIQKPQLILVCEDDKHMVEVLKTIVTNKVEIKGLTLYFTTDLKQISETLAKTLVKFVYDKEQKRYKMEIPEMSILN